MTDYPEYAYKLLAAEDFATIETLGHSQTALDEGDGYVHLSTLAQLSETATMYYSGKQGTVLLEFAVSDLTAMGEVKWEPARTGALFPHLYDKLLISRALRTWVLELDEAGAPVLPEGLK